MDKTSSVSVSVSIGLSTSNNLSKNLVAGTNISVPSFHPTYVVGMAEARTLEQDIIQCMANFFLQILIFYLH